MTTPTIIIVLASILLPAFLFFLYSLCYMSGKESEREERNNLESWRKSITKESLVKYRGVVYHVLEVGNGKIVISNYSDVFPLNVSDVWPVE